MTTTDGDAPFDRPTTVLVTGAVGAIGRHVVPALLKAGFRVRAQFRTKPGMLKNVDWKYHDFSDPQGLDELVAGCDAVLHLAAEIHDVSRMFTVNVDATLELARAAERRGVRRFLHVSSIVVYGSPTDRYIDEGSPRIDVSAPVEQQYRAEPYMREYARTKVLSELALEGMTGELQVIIARPTVVADLIEWLSPTRWPPVRQFMLAHRRTQFVYVGDVVAALVHLLFVRLNGVSTNAQIFNVCDESGGTVKELLAEAASRPADVVSKFFIPLSWLDLIKDLVKYRQVRIRYPLGLLKISGQKLLATGFRYPTGYEAATRRAVDQTAGIAD